jgi:hypothetical protein
MKGWKKIFLASGTINQTRTSLLKSVKANFKPKLVKRDKEGHFTLIKGTMHQEDITIVNIYTANVCMPDCIKH